MLAHFLVKSLFVFFANHDFLSDLLSSGVRSKVVKGQRTYRLFAGAFVFCCHITTSDADHIVSVKTHHDVDPSYEFEYFWLTVVHTFEIWEYFGIII